MTDQPSANIRIYTPDGTMFDVPVIPETSLAQILQFIHFEWKDEHVFVNDGGTAMLDLNRNMLDYNNWHKECGYISSLYIKLKSSLSSENYHEWF